MKHDNVEIRACNFEVRAQESEEHGKYLEGTPIVYDSWTDLGSYDEMIDRGALTNTDLRDVRFLVNHNTDMIPLARSRNNNENSTMQMSIDDDADAKALYSAIERGDISGMSFMFSVVKDNWEDAKSEHPKRHIREIGKVFEVSAVTFPAYEATNISARGLSDALDNAQASLESARAEIRKRELLKAKIKFLSEV